MSDKVILRRKRVSGEITRCPIPVRFNGQIVKYEVGNLFFPVDEYSRAWRCANGMKY